MPKTGQKHGSRNVSSTLTIAVRYAGLILTLMPEKYYSLFKP